MDTPEGYTVLQLNRVFGNYVDMVSYVSDMPDTEIVERWHNEEGWNCKVLTPIKQTKKQKK